jgi:hypothetical protein
MGNVTNLQTDPGVITDISVSDYRTNIKTSKPRSRGKILNSGKCPKLLRVNYFAKKLKNA